MEDFEEEFDEFDDLEEEDEFEDEFEDEYDLDEENELVDDNFVDFDEEEEDDFRRGKSGSFHVTFFCAYSYARLLGTSVP